MSYKTTKKKNLSYTYTIQSFAGEIIYDKNTFKKRFQLAAPAWYQNEINKFEVGDKVTCKLTKKKPKRTEQQNRYYWVYLTEISIQTGHTTEELHEYFKRKFLIKGTKIVYGNEIVLYGSTTEQSVGEFNSYITNIATETEVTPPDTSNYELAPLK